jgi:hypothetical protein
MQGASIISTFQFTSACDETWVVAFDTRLVASERRCEWPSRDMGARLSKRVSPRLPTKLDEVLTLNLWESILPSIKIYTNVSKQDTYGRGNHQSAPSTHVLHYTLINLTLRELGLVRGLSRPDSYRRGSDSESFEQQKSTCSTSRWATRIVAPKPQAPGWQAADRGFS